MKHRWAILCERFSIDQRSNNVTLFGIIDEIHMPKAAVAEAMASGRPTAVQIQSVLLVQTERSDMDVPEKGNLECRLFDAKGIELGVSRTEVNLEQGRRIRSAFNINVLPITSEGIYHYRIFHAGDAAPQQVDELPLYVVFDSPPST
ncbi:MAG TPA: hypothetical protein VKB41_12295 [Steroidobacteraceae bacterium]|nr:hypothetical protein [Steroidobacteraceae bacterium]